MKILVVCQYYYPEPFRITDICEELVKRGHEVTVLTGVPNYPEGIIYDGYKNGEKRDELINGVHVIRCWTIPRKTGAFYRLLNYYSYVLSSCWRVFRNKVLPMYGGDFDVVFVNQLSPVMMAYVGMIYSYIYDKKLVMYCLDLWPESLVAGGIKQESFIYKIFDKISCHIYKSCDGILVTSKSFVEHLSNKYGIDKSNIAYLPQYAEDLFDNIEIVNQKKDTVDLVFAGNIGEIQSVQTIIEAAEILRDNRKLFFHIVGGGTDLERLQNMVKHKKLINVIFYGRKHISEMPEFYAMADAMLVTLADDPLLSLTLPGKVQSYMAAGKPILGAVDGETKAVVEEAGCGMICSSGDSQGLAVNILKFSRLSEEERQTMGRNSRTYYIKEFEKDKFFRNLEKTLFEHQVL